MLPFHLRIIRLRERVFTVSDPSDWSDRQRGAVLASLLSDLLNTVPTARDFWTHDADDLDRRHRDTEVLAAQMDHVLGRDPGLPRLRSAREPF